ncbi:hypothetical protein RchiOBHm_Chr4g0403541 [Rosa chinensis]|uniref:Uncharacterized protein n=1 Tax=Rosa chinensis TaxID=74649 RepID=A0A2P6QTL6_ROSCH|nr:hypothetical protein RchiOBHm_Chr4g0403541 [Rosa chinensis]
MSMKIGVFFHQGFGIKLTCELGSEGFKKLFYISILLPLTLLCSALEMSRLVFRNSLIFGIKFVELCSGLNGISMKFLYVMRRL